MGQVLLFSVWLPSHFPDFSNAVLPHEENYSPSILVSPYEQMPIKVLTPASHTSSSKMGTTSPINSLCELSNRNWKQYNQVTVKLLKLLRWSHVSDKVLDLDEEVERKWALLVAFHLNIRERCFRASPLLWEDLSYYWTLGLWRLGPCGKQWALTLPGRCWEHTHLTTPAFWTPLRLGSELEAPTRWR